MNSYQQMLADIEARRHELEIKPPEPMSWCDEAVSNLWTLA